MEGLADALGWLQSQMAQLHGLTVRVEVDGSAPMPDADLRVLVFQAVRELLFNVIKHAGVTEATVTLASTEDEVVVAVADTGCGFVVAKTSERAKRTGHFGLNSIEERLRLIGGRLELHSRPGQGTRVVIHAPLRLGSR
jgi:two-component system CheB/CheR fusion protein